MVGGRPIDLRVATLPTVHGEKIVMRVLDKASVVLRAERARASCPSTLAKLRARLPPARTGACW